MHSTIRALHVALANCKAKKLEFITSPSDRVTKNTVYVWPWRVQEEALLRNVPLGTRELRLNVSFLFFSQSLEQLDEVRSSLYGTPVINQDSQSFNIQAEPLSAEQQFQLFTAARVRLQPCLSYIVRTSVA